MHAFHWFAPGRISAAQPFVAGFLAALTALVATTASASDCRDLNGSGDLTTSDALIALRGAVGLGGDFTCPPCQQAVCGDGVVAPFDGQAFDGGAAIATCLLLSVQDPSDPSKDLDVVVVKALGASLALVDNVGATIENLGCDCLAELRAFARGHGSDTKAAVATDESVAAALLSTTTTQIPGEFCNCMVRVRVDSPEALAVAEFDLDPRDGYCNAVAIDGAQTDFDMWGPMRIDAGVVEECDDANSASGDGCSAICRIEAGAPIN